MSMLNGEEPLGIQDKRNFIIIMVDNLMKSEKEQAITRSQDFLRKITDECECDGYRYNGISYSWKMNGVSEFAKKIIELPQQYREEANKIHGLTKKHTDDRRRIIDGMSVLLGDADYVQDIRDACPEYLVRFFPDGIAKLPRQREEAFLLKSDIHKKQYVRTEELTAYYFGISFLG